jgi:hypothetical protein
MAKQSKIEVISPYSSDYESERAFYLNIFVDKEEIPPKVLQQLISLELDLHDSKAAVGKLVISSELGPDQVWGRKVANREKFTAGAHITILAGPHRSVSMFSGLYCKEPKYTFKDGRVIVEVSFRDNTATMKKRQRQRRFKGWSVARIVKELAKTYNLTPYLDASNEWLNIVFDDKFSFSQVNQHDASLMDKLCRRFGWRWRVNGDKLELYNPDKDANKPVKYMYGLEYQSGECSIEQFSPKVKDFTIHRTVPKLTRKKFTARIEGGKGKTHPEGKKVPTRKKTKNVTGKGDPDQPLNKDFSKKPSGAPSIGKPIQDPAAKAMLDSPARETGDKTPLEGEAGTATAIDNTRPPKPKEKPEKEAVTIKKYNKYRTVGEMIVAELVLAIPTLRMQPRDDVQIIAGGSEFFSGHYKVKRTRLTVDGQSGKIQVNMLVSRRAWQRTYKIVPIKKGDPLSAFKKFFQSDMDRLAKQGLKVTPQLLQKLKKQGVKIIRADGLKPNPNEGAGYDFRAYVGLGEELADGGPVIKKP